MSSSIEVRVPDLGDFKDIPVIEVLVHPGDSIKPEDPLVTLESDKATMDVPAPAAGVVKDVKVKVGDKVSKGSLVLTLDSESGAQPAAPGETAEPKDASPQPAKESAATQPASAPPTSAARTPSEPTRADTAGKHVPAEQAQPSTTARAPIAPAEVDEAAFALAHASPAVRRLARELGVDLGQVRGTGPKDRILKEDVQAFVKEALTRPQARGGGVGLDLPPWPQVDFAKFGAVESVPLSRIQRISGPYLARNWVMIPHVTQHDEADITALEAFRKAQGEAAKKEGVHLTLLAFVMKACVAALKQFPQFNASLAPDGQSLIVKKYFHIGVAVDTPEGLVVPVIRDADTKGALQIARELAEVSGRARDRKLAPGDMQGGSFSISSLGGIGGTAFTPIINAPEVAILGVSRTALKPVYGDGGALQARLMLPLSLSYDHRVIDGAQGARFITFLSAVLGDIRRLVL
ncbi:MAG: dihydrolipoyllysine-residue acetyltransferase [Betaproteobacteria bacterium]|nr:dihydrolipoyllysine-residue acetyltransferase [Betaproteobacteria bacterium]